MGDPIREHLLTLLSGAGAHIGYEAAFEQFPPELRGKKPTGAPHTAWELLEHLRFAQRDILDFSRDLNYQEAKWPDAYWPKQDTPPDRHAWDETVSAFLADLEEFKKMVTDPRQDLFSPFPLATGKPLLRNVLLVADHNSYHLGQMVYLRKMLED